MRRERAAKASPCTGEAHRMAREIAKTYEPQQIEPRWADFWVREELFKADANAPGPVFSIVIPPPNVTGSLHIGHMLDHTEIDILTRSEEHTSELQSPCNLVCRLLLEKKKHEPSQIS